MHGERASSMDGSENAVIVDMSDHRRQPVLQSRSAEAAVRVVTMGFRRQQLRDIVVLCP